MLKILLGSFFNFIKTKYIYIREFIILKLVRDLHEGSKRFVRSTFLNPLLEGVALHEVRSTKSLILLNPYKFHSTKSLILLNPYKFHSTKSLILLNPF